MKRGAIKIVIVIITIALSGCASAEKHIQSLQSSKDRELTVGVVRKEIKTGMSQADVAQALGSPNIVTRDSAGMETWIYDKIATEASYSKSGMGVGAGAAAGGTPGTSLLLGILTGGYSKNAGASSTTQKTLTIIIKFNNNDLVDSFSYHTSRF